MSNIILINGASSAGKSTLAKAFQDRITMPFLHFSFDLFIDGNILPRHQLSTNTFSWTDMRPFVMDGFHNCLKGLAQAENNLIVDYIIESQSSLEQLVDLLNSFDVFMVGLHCSVPELERRESVRGDRRRGDAKSDMQFVHSFTAYDLELDAEDSLDRNVKTLKESWRARKHPSQFERLAEQFGLGTGAA